MKRSRKTSLVVIGLAYLSFVSLGLPDGLNGVAWPSIRAHFGLPVDALGALLLMFTAGYLASSFSSGRLLAAMSVGTLLSLSCLATAASLVGYALAPAWWVMVLLAVLAGLGAGAIDAGLNTFAATQFSARMVNWLHACYGVGAATGPAIMTRVLASDQPWQRGYAIVGGWQLLLAVCFIATVNRWPSAEAESGGGESAQSNHVRNASSFDTLRQPVVWLSVAVFLVYTGIEAAAGTWAFSVFTESRDVPMTTAGMWVSVYWGALMIGRLASGVVVTVMSPKLLLRFCIIGLALGAALIWIDLTRTMSFVGLGMMGLAAAPIFPTLIAATPRRLGEAHTANAVGFQIAAAVLGQSLLPAMVGVLADRNGLEVVAPFLLTAALLLLTLYEVMVATKRETVNEAAVAG